ncbi:hypothetical protein B0H66DRAFT_592201 [Apodospora peruviana]|uniref:Protein-ribulosamine 3-kinase n=1 Tax=Apodospora peruviana TaxID=516989 RepID=A0AAE0M1V1_9PEZI|nr:hypothetical protein B0H66DRAFT_592201 [Apodospora peruviana]
MSATPTSTLMESISKIQIGDTQSKTERTPVDTIPLPAAQGKFDVDENVIKVSFPEIKVSFPEHRVRTLHASLPVSGSVPVDAQQFGESHWGKTAKLVVKSVSAGYFLKVVPKLGPIGKQMCYGVRVPDSDGRVLKPSLVHGDFWDGNTAMDMKTGEAFAGVCSFYDHNEYDTGNWRAPRHRLSDKAYIKN